MKKLHQVYYGFLKFPTLCLSARCQVLKARSFSFGLRQKASSLQELVLPLGGDYNLVTRIPAYTQYTVLLQESEHFDVIEVFTFEDHPEMDACTDYSRTHPWHCSLRCVGHETLGHPTLSLAPSTLVAVQGARMSRSPCTASNRTGLRPSTSVMDRKGIQLRV